MEVIRRFRFELFPLIRLTKNGLLINFNIRHISSLFTPRICNEQTSITIKHRMTVTRKHAIYSYLITAAVKRI